MSDDFVVDTGLVLCKKWSGESVKGLGTSWWSKGMKCFNAEFSFDWILFFLFLVLWPWFYLDCEYESQLCCHLMWEFGFVVYTVMDWIMSLLIWFIIISLKSLQTEGIALEYHEWLRVVKVWLMTTSLCVHFFTETKQKCIHKCTQAGEWQILSVI